MAWKFNPRSDQFESKHHSGLALSYHQFLSVLHSLFVGHQKLFAAFEQEIGNMNL